MKLYDIVNGKLVISQPNVLAIPEFKVIWDRDKDEDKEQAMRELTYMTFLCDESINNPYRAYKEGEREDVLLKDFIKNPKWKPDKQILEAIKKYKEVVQTTNSRLLKAAKNAADKLSEYFYMIDFKEIDSNGKPVFSAKDLSSNLASVGSIVKSLGMLEDMVKKEQLDTTTIRGGGEIGYYEVPRSDFDYGDGLKDGDIDA